MPARRLVNPTGEITYKSMVYTDYFLRGAEPQHMCTEHTAEYLPYQGPVFSATAFDGIGGLLGVDPVVASPPSHYESRRYRGARSGIARGQLPAAAPAEASPPTPPEVEPAQLGRLPPDYH